MSAPNGLAKIVFGWLGSSDVAGITPPSGDDMTWSGVAMTWNGVNMTWTV